MIDIDYDISYLPILQLMLYTVSHSTMTYKSIFYNNVWYYILLFMFSNRLQF